MHVPRPPRALLASALAAVLVGAAPGVAPGEVEKPAAAAAGSGAPAAEGTAPAAKAKPKPPRKSRKQLEEERKKYQLDPDVAKVFEKARAEFEAQRYAEAEATLGKLDLDDLTPYERAVARRLRGYIAYGREDYPAAITHLRESISEKEALPPRDRADVLFQVAQIQGAQERWKEMIETLQEWLQVVETPNSVGYYLMALAYFQLEDYDAALPPAQKAVEIAKVPQQSWLQLLLALHLSKEDFAAAKPVLDQMVALYPNVGKDYWLQLSAIYGVTGDEAGSLGVLELAHRKGLLTDKRDLLRMLQFMLARGIPYRATQIFEKELAEEHLPEDAETLELLSFGWILARENARATEPLARAADLAETGELYVHLAQIHLLDEHWDDAISVLRKAIAKGGLKDPGTVELMIGIAYYNQQQLAEARSWFAQAQRSGATREQAALWIQHVDRELEAQAYGAGTGG